MSARELTRRRAGSVTVGRPADVLPAPGSAIGDVVGPMQRTTGRKPLVTGIMSFFWCPGLLPPAFVAWFLWRLSPPQPGAAPALRRRRRAVRWLTLPGAVGLMLGSSPGVLYTLVDSGLAAEHPALVPVVLALVGMVGGLPALALHAAVRHAQGLMAPDVGALRALVTARTVALARMLAAFGLAVLATMQLGGGHLVDGGSPLVFVHMALEFVALFALPLSVMVAGRRLAALPVPRPGDARSHRRKDLWLHALRKRGLSSQRTEVGWVLDGTVDGRPVLVDLDLSRHPARLVVEVHAPALAAVAPDLSVRAREDGEPGGIDLSDPILGRLLRVDGHERAADLLDGRHADVLDVVKAHPGSYVADGRVVLVGAVTPADGDAGPEAPDLLDKALDLAAVLDDGARAIADAG